MMEVFSVTTRATIEIAVNDFGTDIDKTIYHEWASDNPQVRKHTEEPIDDGKGPMLSVVRETIIDCLRRRYDHLRLLSRSPTTTANDMAEISIIMSRLYGVARRLNPGRIEWPSSF